MEHKFSKELKTIATVTLILLMAAATITLTLEEPVTAQYYDTSGQYHSRMGGSIPEGVTPDITIPTQAFLAVTPNPIGVGQSLLVNVWLTPATDVSRYHTGYTVTITKPDNTNETKTMDSYYADATAWFNYIPTKTGAYKFQFSFGGDFYAAGTYTENKGAVMLMGGASRNVTFTKSMYYEPSISPVTTVTVQQDPVYGWNESPLPTDYWTRPISPENRGWWTIAGAYPATGQLGGGTNWPADTNPYGSGTYSFVPYVQAPETAHVVWQKQTSDAGLIGGTQGIKSLINQFGGSTPLAIYNGRAYQEVTVGPDNFLECYDLRTADVYWQIPDPIPSTSFFGMRFAGSLYLSYYAGNEEVPGGGSSSFGAGVSLVSIGSNLVKIDPFNGAITLNVTGMSGTFFSDPYVLSVQTLGNQYYPYGGGEPPTYRLINWTVAGSATNFADRVVSNISWPISSLPATTDFNAGIAAQVSSITPEGGTTEALGTSITAYSLTTGEKLWSLNDTDIPYCNGQVSIADHGKIAVLMIGQGYWKAWDLQTGKLVWTSDKMAYPWGEAAFGDYGEQSAYGLLYRESYDGLYAFNWTNGKIAWHFTAPSVPFETGYSGNYSFNGGAVIADGKIYTYNTEHTPSEPITRGWRLFCVNATTGQGIWNITGGMSPGGIADGYLTAGNPYDGCTYGFGKGQSQTTIQTPLTAAALGQSIVITGTVTDKSPAQLGTACVSDDSQTAWMEYLHMQKAIPPNATGVPVTLTVLDANGNYRTIGTTITDITGTYSFMWQPDIPGHYKVFASFAGTKSYGSSMAESAFGVVDAAPTPSPYPVTTLPPTEMYIIGAAIAIIVAVAIVGALIMMMIRKRP